MDSVPLPPLPPKPPLPQQPQVEDVFADTMPAAAEPVRPAWPQPLQPGQQAVSNTPPPPQIQPATGKLSRGRFITLIVAIAVTVLVIAMVFGPAAWSRLTGGGKQKAIANINQVHTITNTTIPTHTNQQIHAPVVDSDGDGLSDADEKSLGTNPLLIDTDNDGLTDRQEVQVYKTNPRNPDTDGDSFNDGDEVHHFYNPNGSGKLLNVNQAINTFINGNTNQ